MDCSPPGSSVHGISQAENTAVGCHFLLQGIFPTQELNPCLLCLLHWQVGSSPLAPPSFSFNSVQSLQSGPTLCHPMDYSLPGSSVHGILQERILEWVAMPSSKYCSGKEPTRLLLLLLLLLLSHFSRIRLCVIPQTTATRHPTPVLSLENPMDGGAW